MTKALRKSHLLTVHFVFDAACSEKEAAKLANECLSGTSYYLDPKPYDERLPDVVKINSVKRPRQIPPTLELALKGLELKRDA